MDIRILEELLLKERLLYVKLSEFEDLTRQLGEALDRRDEISVQMLLNMRGEPANQLQEADGQLRRRLLELPEEDAIRARELLEGGEQQGPAEAAREMDKHISVRMGGNKSFYKKYR